MIILDTETNGLLPECDRIHCAVAYDTVTGSYVEFTPENVHELPSYLNSVHNLACHNGIGFDLKVLKKVLNYEYTGKYLDTLLLSRILWPDIESVGCRAPHSVESWGVRFGLSKPEHEDWSKFTPEMLHRCKEDVKIQTLLYEKIKEAIVTRGF